MTVQRLNVTKQTLKDLYDDIKYGKTSWEKGDTLYLRILGNKQDIVRVNEFMKPKFLKEYGKTSLRLTWLENDFHKYNGIAYTNKTKFADDYYVKCEKMLQGMTTNIFKKNEDKNKLRLHK